MDYGLLQNLKVSDNLKTEFNFSPDIWAHFELG